MLEQLVESKSNAGANRTRGGFLLTTFMLVAMMCFSAVLWSLFAMNVGVGNDEFEMSSLVAPIASVEEKPAPPEPEQPKQENQTQKAVDMTTRQTNTLRIEENPLVPTEISVVPNTQKSRPKGAFIIDKEGIEKTGNLTRGEFNRESNGGGKNLGEDTQSKIIEEEKEEMPELKKTVVKEEKKTPSMVSKGVINGQATSLPKPVYPSAAKAVKAGGEVSVQVTIDESGKVISAKAVSGHTLLRAEAERAARNARFTPTLLSNQPVKVTGIIIYKFALQ
jgi:TonB family protein